MTSRSLIALIEPGTCFAGSLLELALAADRSYMLAGVFEDDDPDAEPAAITVGAMNLGPLPMGNGLTRLADPVPRRRRRRWPRSRSAPASRCEAEDAERARPGHVRAGRHRLGRRGAHRDRGAGQLQPDALTGMEANYRFAGPETMETKIFGRLSAWQNWIFNRPNASGPDGALRMFGTGQRADFDRKRV